MAGSEDTKFSPEHGLPTLGLPLCAFPPPWKLPVGGLYVKLPFEHVNMCVWYPVTGICVLLCVFPGYAQDLTRIKQVLKMLYWHTNKYSKYAYSTVVNVTCFLLIILPSHFQKLHLNIICYCSLKVQNPEVHIRSLCPTAHVGSHDLSLLVKMPGLCIKQRRGSQE